MEAKQFQREMYEKRKEMYWGEAQLYALVHGLPPEAQLAYYYMKLFEHESERDKV